MYEEHSLLAKELQLLINKLKMNEPVDNLLFDMAYIVRCGFRRMHAHFNRIVFGWKPKRIPPPLDVQYNTLAAAYSGSTHQK